MIVYLCKTHLSRASLDKVRREQVPELNKEDGHIQFYAVIGEGVE